MVHHVHHVLRDWRAPPSAPIIDRADRCRRCGKENHIPATLSLPLQAYTNAPQPSSKSHSNTRRLAPALLTRNIAYLVASRGLCTNPPLWKGCSSNPSQALLCEAPDAPCVRLLVLEVELGGLGVSGAAAVWVGEERLDRGEHRRNSVRRRPLVLDDVQAQSPVLVHWRGRRERGDSVLWRSGIAMKQWFLPRRDGVKELSADKTSQNH